MDFPPPKQPASARADELQERVEDDDDMDADKDKTIAQLGEIEVSFYRGTLGGSYVCQNFASPTLRSTVNEKAKQVSASPPLHDLGYKPRATG